MGTTIHMPDLVPTGSVTHGQTNVAWNNKATEAFGRVKRLGVSSYDARMYEPQTQNTFAFEFMFDEAQIKYLCISANRASSYLDSYTRYPGNAVYGEEDNNFGFGQHGTEQALGEINEVLNSSIQSVNSPTKNVGQILMDFFNTQIKYAGKPTYTNANITFNTLIGLGAKNILSAWAEICLNERTLAGGWARTKNGYTGQGITDLSGKNNPTLRLDKLFPNIGYKVDGMLLECARDGSIVNVWEYIGMWISSFTPGNYTMAGANTPSQVTCTISVDKIQQADWTFVRDNIDQVGIFRDREFSSYYPERG